MRKESEGGRNVAIAAAGAFVLLMAMIALSPRHLLYDERFAMESAWFLWREGSLRLLLTTPLDLAAGPVYASLHLLLAPLTQLQLPWIRLVNPICLVIAVVCCSAALRRLGRHRAGERALLLLAVPMLGPTTGLALTELPALALVAMALLAATLAITDKKSPTVAWLFAGICAGLAVLARQSYLPAIGAFALIALASPRHRWGATAALSLALLVPAPVFKLWGGLVPPWQRTIAGGISWDHGVLAFVYLAVCALLIAPGFFLEPLGRRSQRLALLGLGAAMVLAVLAAGFRFPVASRIVAAAPAAFQSALELAADAVLCAAGALFVASLASHAWIRRSDREFLLWALLTAGMTATAAGIGHQFSSRYVLAAFPFALFMLQPWVHPGRWAALRLAAGAALGLASLASYYWNAPPTDPNFAMSAPRDVLAAMPLSPEDKAIVLHNSEGNALR